MSGHLNLNHLDGVFALGRMRTRGPAMGSIVCSDDGSSGVDHTSAKDARLASYPPATSQNMVAEGGGHATEQDADEARSLRRLESVTQIADLPRGT